MRKKITNLFVFLGCFATAQESQYASDFKLNGNVKSVETRIRFPDIEEQRTNELKKYLVSLNLFFSDIRQQGGKGILTAYEDVFVEGITKFNQQNQVEEIQIFYEGEFNNKMNYFFDSEGKRTHKHRTNLQGELLQKGIYTYNEQNKLVEEVYYNAQNQEETKQQYHYDKDGNLLNRYMYAQGHQLFTEDISYHKNLIVKRTLYRTTGQEHSQVTYQYDQQGNLTQLEYYSPDFSYSSMFYYQDHQLTSEVNQSNLFDIIEATFNEKGHVKHLQITDWQDSMKNTDTPPILAIDASYQFDNANNWTQLTTKINMKNEMLTLIVSRTIEYY